MRDTNELKPCPFCGAVDGDCLQNTCLRLSQQYAIYCNHENGCPLDGKPCGAFKTEEEAKAAWNKRVEDKNE